MTRPAAVGFAVFLCVLLVAPTVGGASAATEGAMAQPDGFDRSVFEIAVYENGSAQWTLEHHRVLENDSEIESFEAVAEEFRENETDLYTDFVGGARTLAATGTNATGREMNATGFSRGAEVNVGPTLNDRGTIRMSFRWTNFAVTDGDRVVASDVFEDGLYVAPSQRLTFAAGPGLAFADAAPGSYETSHENLSTSDRVWWTGETQFGPNRPRVELGPASSVGAPGDVGTTEPAPSETAGGAMLVVAVFVAAVGLAGAAVWHSRGPAAIVELLRDVTGGTATASESESASPDREEQSADADSTVPEDQLLSDSDRVIELLEDNGGRMKQVNIVEETEWSKSKVSMLLSDMEEDGDISKLRVGRENIISLAGHEPDAAGSPFEDEE